MTDFKEVNQTDHPLLKANPNFVVAYESIKIFIKESKEDLQSKKDALESKRKEIKSSVSFGNRRLKNYLSCQIFMLRKHLSRLCDFELEVETRLQKILENNGEMMSRSSTSPINSSNPSSEVDGHGDSPDTCETSSIHSAKSSTESGISSCAPNDESFDSYNLSGKAEPEDDPQIDNSQSQELIRLLADINKMKRRCKHILDVTDHYCVLNSLEFEDLEADGMDGLPSPKSPDPVLNRLVWSTFESLSSHIAVIAKSYTKRHSTEFSTLNSSKMN